MNADNATAIRYRERADQLRLIAKNIDDREARETLLAVADDYDRMARQRDLTADIDRRFAARPNGPISN